MLKLIPPEEIKDDIVDHIKYEEIHGEDKTISITDIHHYDNYRKYMTKVYYAQKSKNGIDKR